MHVAGASLYAIFIARIKGTAFAGPCNPARPICAAVPRFCHGVFRTSGMHIRHDRQGQHVDTSRAGAFQNRSRRRSGRAACDDIIDQNYGFSRDCGQFAWRNAKCARHVRLRCARVSPI